MGNKRDQELLLVILRSFHVKIDTSRVTTGSRQAGFRTLEFGSDLTPENLRALWDELNRQGMDARITVVTNPEHPDHGKRFIEMPSFWWEEES